MKLLSITILLIIRPTSSTRRAGVDHLRRPDQGWEVPVASLRKVRGGPPQVTPSRGDTRLYFDG